MNAAPPRSRLATAFSALPLLWVAACYGRDGAAGLFWLTLLPALALPILPRLPKATSRTVIWCALGTAVLALAANIARIAPPEEQAELMRGAYLHDRVVTLFFSLGLTALLFRPSPATATVVAISVLPMAMLTMARTRPLAFGGRDSGVLQGLLPLLALLHPVERWCAVRARGGPAAARAEMWRRLAPPLLAGLVALPLARPIEQGALAIRERLTGMLMRRHLWERRQRERDDALSLRPPPAGWTERRLRILLTISAPRAPGYLRERAYLLYNKGEWLAEPTPSRELEEAPQGKNANDAAGRLYLLPAAGDDTSAAPPDGTPWRYEAPAGRLLTGFCLPDAAVSLQTEGPPPRIDRDGCVYPAAGTPLPGEYLAAVPAGAAPEHVVDLPRPPLDQKYLALPPPLAATVSNWVAACGPLVAATGAVPAARAVERHFARHFRYSLTPTRPAPGADKMESFMTAREGHCALFASAAALMLRAKGFPARVVAGFHCHERHPFDGRFVVRERDSHAWAEIWDAEGQRWLRVEATPAAGLPSAWRRPGRARLAREWLVFAWREMVAAVQRANILGLIAAAGVWTFYLLADHPWAVLPVAAVLAGALLWRRRQDAGDRRETAVLRRRLTREMLRLERRAVPAHLRRRPAENWTRWVRRLENTLPAERTLRLAQLVERYETLRYGTAISARQVAEWRADARRTPP